MLWLHGRKLSTRGVVVTRHPQFGNGIEFVGLFSEDEIRLRAFLERNDSALSDESHDSGNGVTGEQELYRGRLQ